MKYLWLVLIIIAVAAAMAWFRRRGNEGATGSTPIVGHAGEGEPLLALEITHVQTGKQVQDDAPFVVDGGDWTVLDCRARDDATLQLRIAVSSPGPVRGGSLPFRFGKAVLIVDDREAGARVVERVASALGTAVPKVKSPQPVKPLRLSTAVWGEKLESNGGSFVGSGRGTWTATKLFLQNDGFDAEVFFNYDLRSRRAEFTEKDPDYAEDLVGALAAGLRDGPRPPRTLQTDPNLTDRGPRIVALREIPDSKHLGFTFTPAGQLILRRSSKEGSVAWLCDAAQPERRSELVRADGRIDRVLLSDDGQLVAVQETQVAQENTFSPDDPSRFWVIDRANGGRRQLTGPWDKGRLEAFAPDGRFTVISSWEQHGDERRPVTHLLNLQTGESRPAQLPLAAEAVGWMDIGRQPRLVMLTGSPYDDAQPRQAYLVDPLTGAAEPARATADLPRDADPTLSPDRKLRFQLHPHERVNIVDVATGQTRTFTFHEDDQRSADEHSVQWINPRFLLFGARRQAVIDARTLKMSYLADAADAPWFQFDPDFRWAITAVDNSLKIGQVEVPADAP